MTASGDVKADLTEYLRELHLPAIRQCFEEKARQAERETLSYEQYLLDLAERECQERRENRITRLLRGSRLPLEKTMENFDLKRLPAKAARQVKALLDGAFLDRKENVLAFGNPDPGNSAPPRYIIGKTEYLMADERPTGLAFDSLQRRDHLGVRKQGQHGAGGGGGSDTYP